MSPLVIGCVVEALSATMIAAAWLQARRVARSARAAQEEAELQASEHEAQAAQLAQQSQIQSKQLQAAERTLAERKKELEAANERVGQLEEVLRTQDAVAVAPAAEPRTPDPRAAQLEEQLARRDAELRGSKETVEAQKLELARQASELAGLRERGTEIEQALRRTEVRTSELAEHETQSQTALSARTRELDEVRERAAGLAQELRRAETLTNELAEHEARTQTALSARTQEVDELRERGTVLERQLQSAEARANELAEREALTQTALSARTQELDEVRERGTLLEQQLQRAEARANELAEREARTQAALSTRTQELDGARATLERETRAHLELHVASATHASELKAQLAAGESELRSVASLLEAARGALADKAGELDALGERCTVVERALVESEAEVRARGELLAAARGELDARGSQVQSLEARCGDFERQLALQLEEGRNRLDHERQLVQAMSVHASDLEGELAKSTELNARGAARIERLEADARASSAQIESLVLQLAELEQRARRQAELAERREIEDLQLVSQVQARNRELESRAGTAPEELRRMQDELEALAAASEEGRAQLEAARRSLADLEAQLGEQATRAQETEAAQTAQRIELEHLLAARDQELRALRERGASAASLADERAREIEARDRQIAQLDGSWQMLNSVAQVSQDALHSGDALIDELAADRIAALFQRSSHPRTAALPRGYLDGLAEGDLDAAMQGLLGDVQPLTPPSLERLCSRWRELERAWNRERIERHVVYLWAEGLELDLGAENEPSAALVIVAAFVDGTRSLLALKHGSPGARETWLEMLQDLASRGMNAPRLVVAGEQLGIWSAIDELGWPSARQHCWLHKIAQVSSALPRARRARAVAMLNEIQGSTSRTAAKTLRNRFAKRCGVRLGFVAELVTKDWGPLTSFLGFAKEHAADLRTVESLAAPLRAIRLLPVRPRQIRPSPNVSVIVWQLLRTGIRTLPLLDALELVPSLVREGRSKPSAAAPDALSPRSSREA